MDYDPKSVFINCPFDDAYAPLFHAVILTVTGLGFRPRSARESEAEADPRILRIARGLETSKYSLHDLSRYQGQGPDNLARFNMPLELGMAVGLRFERKGTAQPHNWAPLLPPNFVHERFISDLSGYDSPVYDGTPASLIRAVCDWLTQQPDFEAPAPTAKDILKKLPAFERALKKIQVQALGSLTWPAIVAQALTAFGVPSNLRATMRKLR